MVTEIIEQEDFDAYFHMNIKKWIRDGITEDAVKVCLLKWGKINRYGNPDKPRNKTPDNKHINQLNRW